MYSMPGIIEKFLDLDGYSANTWISGPPGPA